MTQEKRKLMREEFLHGLYHIMFTTDGSKFPLSCAEAFFRFEAGI